MSIFIDSKDENKDTSTARIFLSNKELPRNCWLILTLRIQDQLEIFFLLNYVVRNSCRVASSENPEIAFHCRQVLLRRLHHNLSLISYIVLNHPTSLRLIDASVHVMQAFLCIVFCALTQPLFCKKSTTSREPNQPFLLD